LAQNGFVLSLSGCHVKKRIWDVANLLFAAKSDKASQWARSQCAQVERGHSHHVIYTLEHLSSLRKEAKDKVDELRKYLNNNLDRMNYPQYREMGLRVGSGAVESANYHVTGARMKLQGMRWSEKGARYMAYLRR